MEMVLYQYKAKVMSVYDGDTIRVDIDLGLKTWIKNESIRLGRINAPEVRGSEKVKGIKSRDYLRKLILKKKLLLKPLKIKRENMEDIWEKSG